MNRLRYYPTAIIIPPVDAEPVIPSPPSSPSPSPSESDSNTQFWQSVTSDSKSDGTSEASDTAGTEISETAMSEGSDITITDDMFRPIRTVRYSAKLNGWTQTSFCGRGIRTPLPTFLRFITWNIDFASHSHEERLIDAINHIAEDVLKCKSPSERPRPCCILLQEVNHLSFHAILEHEWVKRFFMVTPSSPDEWPSCARYGTATLIARTLPVIGSWSIDFPKSKMTRNALVTDIKLSLPSQLSNIVTLRIANTHLESLPMGAKQRQNQIKYIAVALREEGLHGGVVGGDMNNILPSDLTITEEAGLVDAYAGEEDDEDAYTWGYQPRNHFQPGRLDKVLFTPCEGIEVDSPQSFGVDRRIARGNWVSDHYGLVTNVHIL